MDEVRNEGAITIVVAYESLDDVIDAIKEDSRMKLLNEFLAWRDYKMRERRKR